MVMDQAPPLAKLYAHNGKVLILGSDLAHVTILHYAEYIADFLNKKIVRVQVPILKNNQRVWVPIEDYDSDGGAYPWPPRFFAYVVEKFLQHHKISPFKVGSADSYLLDAKSLVDFSVNIFCKVANSEQR